MKQTRIAVQKLGLVYLALVMAFLAALGPTASRLEAAEPQTTDVFIGGTDGYHTYRIPSLICTSKGTMLAFCEGRKFSADDQGPTDMVLKRSLDDGNTWQPMQVIVDALPEAAMDPTAVIDRATGAVLLIHDRWPKEYNKKKTPGLGGDSVTTWIIASDDEGATWSTPRDITAMTKKPDWAETIHGPGVAIQTRSGRLVVPCSQLRANGGHWWNFAIYSDDHGKTWRRSDNEVGPGVDESQMVELSDGALQLNMRGMMKGCRLGATSNDGGKTWSEMFEIPELPCPTCQGSVLRYTWADRQTGKSRILFCNPGTTGSRQNVLDGRNTGTVRLSYDEGKTWPVAKVIDKGYFGYCCLTVLPDGTIACLYESDGLRKIAMARFSLGWLTDGKD